MIKKLLSLFIGLLISTTFVCAKPMYDANKLCSAPYNVSGWGTRTFFNFTGSTLLAQSIAQNIIKSEFKKLTGENKFKVKLKTYSAKDLYDGRFKSLNISGENLNMEGIHLTSFKANSLCGFNYIQLNKDKIKFRENFLMDFSILISDEDLRKTMISSDYLALLNMLNLKTYGLNLFEIKDVNVKLYNDKFYFILKTENKIFQKSFPLTFVISSKLVVKDGKILLTQVEVENFDKRLNLSQITQFLNVINPLNFTLDIMDNKESQLQVKTIDIIENTLLVEGMIYVPKNTIKKG